MTNESFAPPQPESIVIRANSPNLIGSVALAEDVQYRTEHSRSLEDAGKYKAIQTLIELGSLTPLTEHSLYHGRVAPKADGAEWSVDPSFKNGGNDSGNNNLHSIPTLYTAEKDIAREFAVQRGGDHVRDVIIAGKIDRLRAEDPMVWRQKELDQKRENRSQRSDETKKYLKPLPDHVEETGPWEEWELERAARAEYRDMDEESRNALWSETSKDLGVFLHKIASHDSEALLVEKSLNLANLSEPDRLRYWKSLAELLPPASVGSPMDFENSPQAADNYKLLMSIFNERALNLRQRSEARIRENDILSIAEQTDISPELVRHIASVINARELIVTQLGAAMSLLLRNGSTGIVVEGNDKQDVPVSLEYIGRFLRDNHIVGLRGSISSATINKVITAGSLFDLQKVNDKDRYTEARTLAKQKFGALTHPLHDALKPKDIQKVELLTLLQDPHAKPHKIVELASGVQGFEQEFNKDAGNWEGFTLGEHTETVLRNFDENFADVLPVELLAPMRLALVAHDIGKPMAVEHGKKHHQDIYNAEQAELFFESIGLDNKTSLFLQSIIGEGMKLAFDVAVRGNNSALIKLEQLAQQSCRQFTGKNPSNAEVAGFVDLCEIALTCDGGAYTTMATTRSSEKGVHRNAGSFNSSFNEPVGLGRRDLKLKNGNISARLKEAV